MFKPRRYLPVTILLAGVGLCASWASAQSERGDPTSGEAVYKQQCFRCHGDKLDGQGPDAKWLIVPPADLSSRKSRSKEDWELLVSIYHGVLFTPMHGFRDTLSYDQIRDVLSYIRSMAPYGGIS